MGNMSKEARAVRDADFKAREQPRMLWPSTEAGTALRVVDSKGNVSYRFKPAIRKKSGARKLTEAEDNALGRAIRRRANRRARNKLRPFCQR